MDENTLDKYTVPDASLNFPKLFRTIKRNKNIFLKFISVGVALGFISIFLQKKVWQGVFQIVLEDSSYSNNTISRNIPREFSSLIPSQTKKQLKTEIEILKSPSVLMPVFDFVKNEKLANGENFSIRFDKWRKNNLNIELEKGTTVLNISYKDTNRDLIVEVLNKIANEYKTYSGKDKKIEKINSSKYFNKKLAQYEKEAALALDDIANFEEKYDLAVPIVVGNKDRNKYQNSDTEITKLRSASKKRILETYLNQLLLLKENKNQKDFVSIVQNIPEVNQNSSNIKALEKIEGAIIARSQNYKDEDIKLKELKRSKEIFIDKLIDESIGILKGAINLEEVKIKASYRSPEILSEYRKLLVKSLNKSSAYVALEKEKIAFDLKSSRFDNPWELITKPTLLPFPISPLKKRTLILFTFASLFIGLGYITNKEKIAGVIYEKDELDQLLDFPYLDTLSIQEINNWDKSIKLIKSGILNNPKKDFSLSILKLVDNQKNEISILEDKLKKIINLSEFKITDDISVAIDYKNLLFIIELGYIKKNGLKEIINKLDLQNIDIKGWILLTR
ncbi:Wzz/FepE/Etk N-terminal domain-containing protein [Prochlorococcus sp. AH-716-I17]|nr:Wzz/FepE/Etk N-terminal domain-containing protein [Prochlorococcus sp. AH-716-I17]